MMTSWNETKLIEAHIWGSANRGNALLFEAMLILDSDLTNKVVWQQKAYDSIQQYGRRQLKNEIEAVHQLLFAQPEYRSFRQKIRLLFSKH